HAVPGDVQAIVLRALAKQPEQRFGSMEEFGGACLAVLQQLYPAEAGSGPRTALASLGQIQMSGTPGLLAAPGMPTPGGQPAPTAAAKLGAAAHAATLPTPKPDAAAVSPARFVPVGTPAPVAPPSSAPAPFAPPPSAPAPFAPPASAVPTDTRREVPPPRRTPSALRRSQPPDEPDYEPAPPAPAYRERRS